MKRALLFLTIVIAMSAISAQQTTRRGLQPKATETTTAVETVMTDTVVNPGAHDIDINGYDKPLRSRRETFFVTNNDKRATESITFTITYFDNSKRQLHQRTANIPLNIPAGETRQASLKSWDEQQSFYYIRSAVPERASQATPYDVKISIDTIFYIR